MVSMVGKWYQVALSLSDGSPDVDSITMYLMVIPSQLGLHPEHHDEALEERHVPAVPWGSPATPNMLGLPT